MSVTVAFAISYFNDYPCILFCLNSLIRNGELKPDLVIGVDGIYRGFNSNTNSKSKYSTDGTTEAFQKLRKHFGSKRVVLSRLAGKHERYKRQHYVDIAARHKVDFLFILDADERIATSSDWDSFRRQIEIIKRREWRNVYGIMLDDEMRQVSGTNPRLWFRPEQMRYDDVHYHFKRKDMPDDPGVGSLHRTITDFAIIHDHSCRNKGRQDLSDDYEKRLPSIEIQ